MALDNANLTWNANTEPDLLGYFLWFGLYPGIYTVTVGITAPQAQYTVTAGQFNSDGLWYFALQSRDTSGNVSALSTPVTKRIVRTANRFIHRR